MQKRILIIDDDQDYVRAVSDLLISQEYEVSAAHNGKDGIQKAKQVKPDLIILDIMMAYDSEGLDVSKQLSAEESLKKIPVIMVSGIKKADSLTVDYATGEKLLDVRAVLEKPVEPESFLRTVKSVIQ